MAPASSVDSDPFADPDNAAGDHDYTEGWTLPVGRSASLTLATDSLIVLGMQHLRDALYKFQELRTE